ncbi:Hypothetical predicted protein [Mytilus galloprovincialis]|uniref:Uncharacterized protein n=2 Tax=Mytilus galloprovincialis TaxID=29158 RepID=A0A8B6DQB0_MYTGA|nr:Hypothetical predicted protein [Mytilus galloprovincialis]
MLTMLSRVNISVHGKVSYQINYIYSNASYFTAPKLGQRKLNFTQARGNIVVFSKGYFKSFSKFKFPSQRPIMFTKLTETVSKYNFTISDRLKISKPTASYLNASKIDGRALQNIPEHLKIWYTYFMKFPGESDGQYRNHKFHENVERKKSSKSSDDSSTTPSTNDSTVKTSSKSFEDLSPLPYTEDFTVKTSSKLFEDSSSTPYTEDFAGKTSSKSFDDLSTLPYREDFTVKTSSKLFDDSSSTPYTEDFAGKTSSESFDDLSSLPYREDFAGKTSSKSFVMLDDSSSTPLTDVFTGKTSSESFDDLSSLPYREDLQERHLLNHLSCLMIRFTPLQMFY